MDWGVVGLLLFWKYLTIDLYSRIADILLFNGGTLSYLIKSTSWKLTCKKVEKRKCHQPHFIGIVDSKTYIVQMGNFSRKESY
jgi:hypothetical protein